jgi:recombination protein RecT|nr:MAG TPA: RecT protein [Caudoviricetes sp.]
MAVNNSLVARQNQKLGLTAYLTQDAVKNQINSVIGGRDGQKFIASIVSAVNTNPALSECTNQSILSAALLGESLKLSPSPQLGHYYMVPFNDKEKGKVAQFQLGYKGYIQLAIRSGQYKKINVLAIKKGELQYFDPLNEDIQVQLMVDDWDAREQAETIGYYAMFELTNGFRKALYWSRKQMESHALKYSQGYKRDKDKGTAWTFWSKDFDGMAYKTMLRQLISKWGIMSIELQNAFDADMAVINEDGSKSYVENDDSIIDMEQPQETPQHDQMQDNATPDSTTPVPQNVNNDAQMALFS